MHLIRRKILTGNRFIYIIIGLFLLFIFVSRIAGENFQHLFYKLKLIPKSKELDEYKSYWNIRDGIDDAGLIIFGLVLIILIFLYQNRSIKQLLTSIGDINAFGITFNKLERKLEKLEQSPINIDIEHQYSKIYESIIKIAKNPDEVLEFISLEIETRLKETYKLDSPQAREIPPSIINLIEILRQKNLLDSDIGEILKDFFNLKLINANKNKGRHTLSLIAQGQRVLRLLMDRLRKSLAGKHVYGKIQRVKIGIPTIKEANLQNIVVYSTVNIVDSLYNYFPLENLDISNFSVIEKYKGVEKEATILKVEPLYKEKTELFLILAIDCSGSMDGDNKLQKSKEASFSMLQNLSQYPILNSKIAILKISTENGGFSKKWYSLQDINSITSYINSLIASGGTPLWQALQEAIALMESLPKESYKMIICVTDGDDKDDNSDALYDSLKDKASKSQIPITPVMFFGKDDDNSVLTSKMIKLSEISGSGTLGVGAFADADPKDLNGIFESIVKSITKSYSIYWKSTATEIGTNINATLSIKYRTGDGLLKEDFQEFPYKIE